MANGSVWLVPAGVTSAMGGSDPHPYARLSVRGPSFVTCSVNVAPAGSPTRHTAPASPPPAASGGALVASAGPASVDDEVPETVPPHAAQASMKGTSRLSVMPLV